MFYKKNGSRLEFFTPQIATFRDRKDKICNVWTGQLCHWHFDSSNFDLE